MHKTQILEVGGQWVVSVESEGGRQNYYCETLEQARRWVSLLRAPVRSEKPSLRGRPEA